MRIAFALAVLLFAHAAVAAPSLRRTHKQFLAEAAAADKHGLTRLKDQAQLERAIKQQVVVRVPDSGVGFAIDAEVGKHATANQEYYRYARPHTLLFIERLGKEYASRAKNGQFVISSLVRTCKYQRLMRRKEGNTNAADCESTHTTGATIDIKLLSIADPQRKWFKRVLVSLRSRGYIHAAHEVRQAVYHVMVLPTFDKSVPLEAKTKKTVRRKR